MYNLHLRRLEMENLPRSDMILAGFLVHLTLTSIIRLAQGKSGNVTDSVSCENVGISWVLLIVLSQAVAIMTVIRSGGNKIAKAVLAFVGSFSLNLSGNSHGYVAIYCSRHHDYSLQLRDIYLWCTIPVMVLAAILVMVRFLKRETSYATGENTNCPDPEITLLGVCVQIVVNKIRLLIRQEWPRSNFCWVNGMGLWLEM